MDFKRVLDRLLECFSQEGVRWALTGGFAMGVLGVMRATADIESLIEANLQTLDWDLLKSYFETFDLQSAYADLKTRLGHA
jgi:hypothetical protein